MRLSEEQEKGAQWIWSHWKRKQGCLLADQQGFGKTAQTIRALQLYGNPQTLILVPLSVLHQWKAEFAKWGCTQKVFVYHENDWEEADITITTYDTFKIRKLWKK